MHLHICFYIHQRMYLWDVSLVEFQKVVGMDTAVKAEEANPFKIKYGV